MWIYNLPVFKQLVELLHWILVTLNNIFAGWGLSSDWTWGLAIIGLTIIVRLILFPVTWKQYSNAQALQALQPKIKELQRKHKDDRNKLQAETMRVYSEHRVNPFASCLPLLLQLPVFIALYGAISGKAEYLDQTTVKQLSDAGFLWIKSVAEGGGGLGMPDPYYILLVLYVVTQLISTELMLATQSDKMQKWLMRSMPIIFVFFLWNFPSGLFVYWVTTNLWTIGQQLLIRKAMKPYQAPADDDAKPAKRNRIADALAAASHKAHVQRQAAAEETRPPSSARKSGAPAGGKAATGAKSGAKPGPGAKPGGGTRTGTSVKAGGGKPGAGGKPAQGAKPGARPGGGKPGAKPATAGNKPGAARPRPSGATERPGQGVAADQPTTPEAVAPPSADEGLAPAPEVAEPGAAAAEAPDVPDLPTDTRQSGTADS